MRAGGVTAKVYQETLDVDIDAGVEVSRNRAEGWLRLARTDMKNALDDIRANSESCFLATSIADVKRAKKENKVAILLGTEGARWLEGSLDPLREFHEMGLRELQLVWAFPNALVPDGRLSPFGRKVVEECERLGIVVDLTHLPPGAFEDVVALTDQPVIVSHGSAAGVTVDITDSQLKKLASTGGLIGIHFYQTYLGKNPKPENVVRQVDYIANLIGIDHVALGVDFFPTHGAWLKLQQDQGAFDLQWAIEDMSKMPLITRALLDHGFSEGDIRKVLGLNFTRVYQEVIGS
jgi:membrane dipeptidase